MKNYYTEEEKNKLRKAFDLVLDDIRELWNTTANYDEELTLDLNYFYPFHKFGISKKKIWCDLYGAKTIIFENRNAFGKVVRPRLDDYDIMYVFLDNYEKIRGVVKAEVEAIVHGNQDFKNIDSILKKYDKEASIEINMPTQNQQQIKVDYEDGKTVGLLDFGDRTIKIVTNGSIVLVDKDGVIKAEAKSKIKI